MKPSISIIQAAEHRACRSGLASFALHFCELSEFKSAFEMLEEGDLNLSAFVDTLQKGGVDVDSQRELHTLDKNSIRDLIWALRRINLPLETLNNVCRKTAIFAAESVLHIFEKKHPDDKRPRKAIEVAKAYLTGDINREELREARAAAYAVDAADAADAARDQLKKSIRDYLNSLLIEVEI